MNQIKTYPQEFQIAFHTVEKTPNFLEMISLSGISYLQFKNMCYVEYNCGFNKKPRETCLPRHGIITEEVREILESILNFEYGMGYLERQINKETKH